MILLLLILGWNFAPHLGKPAWIIDTNSGAKAGQPLWAVLTGQDLNTDINHWLFGPKYGLGVYTAPAIDERRGRLYFGAGDHRLYCITLAGQILWYFEAEGAIDASPAISGDGTIYIGDWHGVVYSLRPDGTPKWRYLTKSWGISGSPAIGKDGTG